MVIFSRFLNIGTLAPFASVFAAKLSIDSEELNGLKPISKGYKLGANFSQIKKGPSSSSRKLQAVKKLRGNQDQNSIDFGNKFFAAKRQLLKETKDYEEASKELLSKLYNFEINELIVTKSYWDDSKTLHIFFGQVLGNIVIDNHHTAIHIQNNIIKGLFPVYFKPVRYYKDAPKTPLKSLSEALDIALTRPSWNISKKGSEKLVYLETAKDILSLVYSFYADDEKTSDIYYVVVDALNGKILRADSIKRNMEENKNASKIVEKKQIKWQENDFRRDFQDTYLIPYNLYFSKKEDITIPETLILAQSFSYNPLMYPKDFQNSFQERNDVFGKGIIESDKTMNFYGFETKKWRKATKKQSALSNSCFSVLSTKIAVKNQSNEKLKQTLNSINPKNLDIMHLKGEENQLAAFNAFYGILRIT